MGVQAGSTRYILQHKYFEKLDIPSLEAGTLKPSFVPEPITSYAHINTLPAAKPFKGDQQVFAEF